MSPLIRVLPVQPLLEVVAHLGGPEAAAALGVSHETVRKWRCGERPTVFVDRADQYAVRLGLHPALIWGDAWWNLPTRWDIESARKARNRQRSTERAAS